MSHVPVVAIIGRPNVGKSSLFNRFVGRDKAIVSEIPGTTRDFIDSILKTNNGKQYQLIDTAGIMELEMEDEGEQNLEKEVQKQVRYAIDVADVLVFLVDVQEKDLLPTDREAADFLRKSKKPFILVANKCDSPRWESHAVSMYELGLGEPLLISVAHKMNIEKLRKQIDLLVEEIPFGVEENPDDVFAKIALIGTPNVGKSALFNAIFGQKRALVSDVAGTTRDAFDTEIIVDEKKYLLIDTAGIRRRGSIEKGIEKFSIIRTERSIRRADVCLLVLDAKKGIAKQDMHVVQHILEQKKGLIIVVNKWDLVKQLTDLPDELRLARITVPNPLEQFVAYLRYKFPFLPWAPAVFVSAKNNKNIDQIFPIVNRVMAAREQRIETGKLNSFIERVILKHKPTGTKSYMPKISYVSQVDVRPPHFLFFVNDKQFFHFSYPRYLENMLREKYGFEGTPITIELRNKKKKDYKNG